ncbi:hypothetical protein SDC9_134306 [bioreactor metagenome]|uniref:Uncharacterized protein n=1 Tax=bioreactor metagenome TaxID=1076179 RepID=A0A645DF52_9ZZZZ
MQVVIPEFLVERALGNGQLARGQCQVAAGGRNGAADQLGLDFADALYGMQWGHARGMGIGGGGGIGFQFGRQAVQAQARAFAHQQHALHHIAQLPDVARPGVGCEPFEYGVIDRRQGLAMAFGKVGEEMLYQPFDVALPVAQCRDADRGDGDAVVEIHAEAAGRNLLAQVAVGCGDQPEIGLARRVFAQAIDLAVFEHAQQVGLKVHRHLADFIQEQGSPIGGFDLADQTAAAGASEGAVYIAEEFAGEQLS